MTPTTHSNPDQLDRLITPDRFCQLLALAQSGHAIAARTGQPVSFPDSV